MPSHIWLFSFGQTDRQERQTDRQTGRERGGGGVGEERLFCARTLMSEARVSDAQLGKVNPRCLLPTNTDGQRSWTMNEKTKQNKTKQTNKKKQEREIERGCG